jgi:biopolymer transport protein ExbB
MSVDSDRTATGAGHRQSLFEQFVIAGGPIVWFVLLPMSLVTVYLSVEHGLTIRRKKLLPSGVGAKTVDIVRQQGPEQLQTRIADRGDFVSVAVVKAVTQGKGDWFRMRNLLFESLQEQASRLMCRIEWLNLIGNVSPMVGLFGTVFGMIKLFNAIVTAGGQPQPAHLAGGISVALVTTFWGLFIAIPALAIHGVFRNRIETLANDAVIEAENIVPEIRRSIKKQMVSTAEPRTAARLKQPIGELLAKSRKASGGSVSLR